MSESIVERVARAMAVVDKGNDHWDVMSEDGDGFGYVGKNEYRDMARAAIEAMREPTPDMLSASFAEYEEALNIWQGMIDEALRQTAPDGLRRAGKGHSK